MIRHRRSVSIEAACALAAMLGLVAGCSSDDAAEPAETTIEAVTTAPVTTVPVTTLAQGGLTLSAGVTSDLVDQQVVTVIGDGFDDSARVVQCALDDLQVCWSGPDQASGAFVDGEATIEVRRIVPRTAEDGSDIDCATGPGVCVLRLAIGDDAALVPGAPLLELTFDPDTPSRSLVEVTVTPNELLVDGQVIVIEASNLGGDSVDGLDLEVCAAAEVPWCVAVPLADAAPAGGSVAVEYTAVRELVDPTGTNGTVDCAVTACSVRVRSPGSPVVEVVLEFDASVPLFVEPSLELLPTDDPRGVQVLGAGLAPGSGLTVVACVQGQPSCVPQTEPVVTVDADGRIDTVLTLPEQVDGLDCVPGTCAFSIASAEPVIYLAPVFAPG